MFCIQLPAEPTTADHHLPLSLNQEGDPTDHAFIHASPDDVLLLLIRIGKDKRVIQYAIFLR